MSSSTDALVSSKKTPAHVDIATTNGVVFTYEPLSNKSPCKGRFRKEHPPSRFTSSPRTEEITDFKHKYTHAQKSTGQPNLDENAELHFATKNQSNNTNPTVPGSLRGEKKQGTKIPENFISDYLLPAVLFMFCFDKSKHDCKSQSAATESPRTSQVVACFARVLFPGLFRVRQTNKVPPLRGSPDVTGGEKSNHTSNGERKKRLKQVAMLFLLGRARPTLLVEAGFPNPYFLHYCQAALAFGPQFPGRGPNPLA